MGFVLCNMFPIGTEVFCEKHELVLVEVSVGTMGCLVVMIDCRLQSVWLLIFILC